MASLCSKPTGLARLPGGGGGGEGGDLSVNCRPGCYASGYLSLKQGRYVLLFLPNFSLGVLNPHVLICGFLLY